MRDRIAAKPEDFVNRSFDDIDEAKRQTGVHLVELKENAETSITEAGVGEYPTLRLTSLDRHARGLALMARITGTGSPEADGPEIAIGRIAQGDTDASWLRWYVKSSEAQVTWASTTGTNVTLTGPDLIIAQGTARTLLIGLGWCELKSQVTGGFLYAAVRLFASNIEGSPGKLNTAALGPFAFAEKDNGWHGVSMFHMCMVEHDPNAIKVLLPTIRLKHTGTADPLNLLRGAWLAVMQIPL